MNRDDADECVEHLWDLEDDSLTILDCQAVRHRGTPGVRVAYDFMGNTYRRTLTTLDSVERFLDEHAGVPTSHTTEVESWDADMGL